MVKEPLKIEVSMNGGTLTANPATVTLNEPDDWVWWTSSTTSPLPDGSTLMVQFEHPFEVFSGVRGVAPLSVVAKGNAGDGSSAGVECSYFLFLLQDGRENLIKSKPFTIINKCTQENRSPWLHITYHPSAPPEARIDPEPTTLFLNEGDPVFCKMTGVPADHIVALIFPTGNLTTGPFSTSFVTPMGGEGTDRMATGMFTSLDVGETTYHIKIWDGNGNLVAFHDPSIDGLGRPPGT
jgi:hypothetical protein